VVRAAGGMAGTVFDRDYSARRRLSAPCFTRLTTCHRIRAQPWAGTLVRLSGRIPQLAVNAMRAGYGAGPVRST
jgi:hypothetical protein